MDTFRADPPLSKQDHDKVIELRTLRRLMTICFITFFSAIGINTASAQPSKATHPMVKSKSGDVSGVDTITPKEAEDKTNQNGSGWNGSYLGVNAGTSFGATAGTNVVVPLGSSDNK